MPCGPYNRPLMSQITRCPACATSFKVVADQLRISEGWVRCGQCKEVFDAAAHLLPSAPPALLPDVSLTDVKPPPAPVARASDEGRAWGAPPPAAAPVASQVRQGAAPLARTPSAPLAAASTQPLPAATVAPPPWTPPAAPALPEVVHPPVMEVPTPAVPAFLTAGAQSGLADGLSLEPDTPFAWRSPLSPRPRPAEPPAAVAVPAPQVQRPAEDRADDDDEEDAPPNFMDTVPASLDALEELEPYEPLELPRSALKPQQATAAPGQNPTNASSPSPSVPSVPSVPGGYELPVADLPDSDWPADLLEADTATEGAGVLNAGGASALATPPAEIPDISFPALDVALPSDKSTAPLAGFTRPRRMRDVAAAAATGASREAVESNTAPAPDASPAADPPSPDALSLVADDSAAAVLRADPRRAASARNADDEDAESDPASEVSFVRAARRQAFWRQRWVRGVLLLVALVSLAALALQVAVQERDRIAAMDPRARPWLMKLCEPLRCEIAPPRQIADVVIDSSSFNKARGDSYQLALTMKNQASIPLAMPAVELTLTDAQDQPVLRRVLLPTDLAAPAELPARGEWSASAAVIVTTGGARVAGYRLLAFYP